MRFESDRPTNFRARVVPNAHHIPDNIIIPPTLNAFESGSSRIRFESFITYKPLFLHNGSWAREIKSNRIDFIPRTVSAICDELTLHQSLNNQSQIAWIDLRACLTEILSDDFSLNKDYIDESIDELLKKMRVWMSRQTSPSSDLRVFFAPLQDLLVSIREQYYPSTVSDE